MTLCLLATVLATGTFARALPASAAVSTPSDCRNPSIPAGFHKEVITAIRASKDLPIAWGRSPYLLKIACWQGTAFDTRFSAHAPEHVWHGLFAMTVREMAEIAGPSLGNDRDGLILQPACFVGGWDACRHTISNTRIVQQLVAGMRWIWMPGKAGDSKCRIQTRSWLQRRRALGFRNLILQISGGFGHHSAGPSVQNCESARLFAALQVWIIRHRQ